MLSGGFFIARNQQSQKLKFMKKTFRLEGVEAAAFVQL
jgi:hypothetical protein